MSGKDTVLDFLDSEGPDHILYDQTDGHTHTFTKFPTSAVDDEEEEEGDKSQLLKGENKRSASFWTFEYYQQLFDVETTQVFHRVAGSMMPLPNKNYLETSIRPNPDIYGPFWICTTLVFTTAIAGNLANYLSSWGKDYRWRYDFHKVTFAATAIFSYWWMIPAVMYGFLWWRRSPAGFSFLEILCVYGYSLAIYIPISVLWVINIAWFKWVLVIVGAALSGGVLVITFWPVMKDETKKLAFIFVGIIFLLHLGLAAGFVLYFFHAPPGAAVTMTTAPQHLPEKINPNQLHQQPADSGLLKQQTGLQTGSIDNNKLVGSDKPVNNLPVGGVPDRVNNLPVGGVPDRVNNLPVGGVPDRVKSAANALPNSVNSGPNAANGLQGQVVQTGDNLDKNKSLIDMTAGAVPLNKLPVDNNAFVKPVANDLDNTGVGKENAVEVKRETSIDNKGDTDGNIAKERMHA